MSLKMIPASFASRDTQAGVPRQRSPVAVLLSRFPTVTETFILREIIELERQAQPVCLVPMLREYPKVIHEDAKPWEERALYTTFLSRRIVMANLEMLWRHPLKLLILFLRLMAGTLRSPSVLLRTIALLPKSIFLAKQLQEKGIRHVHAHYATHPTTMALIVAELSEATFSFTVHAHDIFVDRSLLRWKLREAQFIRSISKFNRCFLERLYPNETSDKVKVIHVGIEPKIYEELRSRIACAQEPPKVLCVAAHRPYKGLTVLIEACRILRDEGIRPHCDIVGSGPMTAELGAQINKAGVGDVLHLVGQHPQDIIARMMGEAALFVLPSIIAEDGQMEGIPVALMEALASGCPVVSTCISGIPELVEDGINGLLVPPGDPGALAKAIRRLLESPKLRTAMGQRGQQKIRAEFTLRACVRDLADLLDCERTGGKM
jgi:colanic acid/amylovoran biosynthesis glycosyltransferase